MKEFRGQAVAYCYVPKNVKKSVSLHQQRQICKEYAVEHGLELLAAYDDPPNSAALEKMSGFMKAIENVLGNPHVSTLLLYDDRLYARRRGDFEQFRQQLFRAGKVIVSIRGRVCWNYVDRYVGPEEHRKMSNLFMHGLKARASKEYLQSKFEMWFASPPILIWPMDHAPHELRQHYAKVSNKGWLAWIPAEWAEKSRSWKWIPHLDAAQNPHYGAFPDGALLICGEPDVEIVDDKKPD